MARAGLGWHAKDLAERSGINRVTIARFESGSNIVQDSIEKLKATFEANGVKFIYHGKGSGAFIRGLQE